MQNPPENPLNNSVSHEFDDELRLVTSYKEKVQNSSSTLSKEYYQKKLDKQIKRVLRILAVLEAGNPTFDAIKDKIK